MELSSVDDNVSKEVFLRVKIALGKVESLAYTALNNFTTPYMFPAKDLKNHTLDPVRRNNSIVIERLVDNSGNNGTIIIGRRN